MHGPPSTLLESSPSGSGGHMTLDTQTEPLSEQDSPLAGTRATTGTRATIETLGGGPGDMGAQGPREGQAMFARGIEGNPVEGLGGRVVGEFEGQFKGHIEAGMDDWAHGQSMGVNGAVDASMRPQSEQASSCTVSLGLGDSVASTSTEARMRENMNTSMETITMDTVKLAMPSSESRPTGSHPRLGPSLAPVVTHSGSIPSGPGGGQGPNWPASGQGPNGTAGWQGQGAPTGSPSSTTTSTSTVSRRGIPQPPGPLTDAHFTQAPTGPTVPAGSLISSLELNQLLDHLQLTARSEPANILPGIPSIHYSFPFSNRSLLLNFSFFLSSFS